MEMKRAIPAVFVLFIACSAASAAADNFPSRPITIISPYAAGSGNDILARTVGKAMGAVFKQTVVIENRDGASGTIGLAYVSRAKPDGYTLVMGGIGSVVLHPALEGDRKTFNPQSELAPVALVAKASPVLVVNAALGVKTLAELIALAHKTHLTYGSPGAGSAMHLTGELMKDVTGAPVAHVPYRGQSLVMNDVLSGTISFAFLDPPVVLPFVADNKVRIIAAAGKERAVQFPDVPTTSELGYPRLVMENWYAIYAPHGTPSPIVARLTEAIRQGMALPEIRQVIEKTTGLMPLAEGPDALQKQTLDDDAKWQPLAAKIRQ
jgi:tripartite-type tricarboxylate transporter receptor subunit TctC